MFFTAGRKLSSSAPSPGALADLRSKKHFYLFSTEAKKVKVAIKESRVPIQHGDDPPWGRKSRATIAPSSPTVNSFFRQTVKIFPAPPPAGTSSKPGPGRRRNLFTISFFTPSACRRIIPPRRRPGRTIRPPLSQRERRTMGPAHHKAPAPAGSAPAGRRGEGSIERAVRRPVNSAGAPPRRPGAHAAYKYAGDRKTKGPRPGTRGQMAASLPS